MTQDSPSGRPVVLVDARNVIRSRWPNLDPTRFVELTRRWAEEKGVEATMVFDGTAPGSTPDLVSTGGRSADDWIAERAAELAREGRRTWLVSSDRELRARVRPYVDRTIGGGTFAGELEALAERAP